jgi:hypothetical protein
LIDTQWPIGTQERVWLGVLLYTGLRRGDAVRAQHVRDGVATIRTEKTGITVTIPILSALGCTPSSRILPSVIGGPPAGLDNPGNYPYAADGTLTQVGQAKSMEILSYGTPSGLTTNIKDLNPKRRLSERQKKKGRWPIKLACQLLSMSIPTGHNLFGFLYRSQTPPQLGHLLPHRIFHDLSFLDSEDGVLRRRAVESNDVKIDVPGSGPILLKGAADAAV